MSVISLNIIWSGESKDPASCPLSTVDQHMWFSPIDFERIQLIKRKRIYRCFILSIFDRNENGSTDTECSLSTVITQRFSFFIRADDGEQISRSNDGRRMIQIAFWRRRCVLWLDIEGCAIDANTYISLSLCLALCVQQRQRVMTIHLFCAFTEPSSMMTML